MTKTIQGEHSDKQSLRNRLQEIKMKKQQSVTDLILQKDKIGEYGRDLMPVPILLKSYYFLQKLVQNSPKNTIKLNIPETLICGHDPVITFMYTNENGFIEIELLNNNTESQQSCSGSSDASFN